MKTKFDALINEIDKDTLANIALAAAAGLVAAIGGKKIYTKYKEKQLLKKYEENPQEKWKHRSFGEHIRDELPNINDIIATSRNVIDAKK